jgi:hypothetical protein
MMRKISAYARKLRRTNETYNAAEWLNTLTKCRPFGEDKLPVAIATETSFDAMRRRIIETRLSFERIKLGTATPEDFDLLAHATGIAKVRYAQIAGNDNEAVTQLDIADAALTRTVNRFKQSGRWGFDGPALIEVMQGIDLYEQVATSSSPAQMEHASIERTRILEEQRRSMQ